jgi:hypothetical protein
MKQQRILTFDFKIGLAREIIAFAYNALVSSAVIYFRIFDDHGKYVIIHYKGKLLAFVAFLKYVIRIRIIKCVTLEISKNTRFIIPFTISIYLNKYSCNCFYLYKYIVYCVKYTAHVVF